MGALPFAVAAMAAGPMYVWPLSGCCPGLLPPSWWWWLLLLAMMMRFWLWWD